MVSPIQITINLPETITDKQAALLKELADLVKAPALPAPLSPATVNLKPLPNQNLANNQKNLSAKTQLGAALDRLVTIMKKSLVVIAYPTFFAGGVLLILGLSQTLILLATVSLPTLMESQALIHLLLGGILYKFGQDLMGDNDLNTILGNLLYIPLPFFLHLAK